MQGPGELFESDVIAPEQFLEVFNRSNHLEPEQELVLAILTDAVECILKYLDEPLPMRAKLFGEAHNWLFDQDEKDPFSFLNVCEILNLDPSYLRRGIMTRMRAKAIPQPQPVNKSARIKRVGALKLRSNRGQRSRPGL